MGNVEITLEEYTRLIYSDFALQAIKRHISAEAGEYVNISYERMVLGLKDGLKERDED